MSERTPKYIENSKLEKNHAQHSTHTRTARQVLEGTVYHDREVLEDSRVETIDVDDH